MTTFIMAEGMQGLHLSINVKLIDLKNARFMYSNGYRIPWENDDTYWTKLEHPLSPQFFKHTQLFSKSAAWDFALKFPELPKKNILKKKTTGGRNIHHRLGDSPSCFFRMKFHDKLRPNLKISRPLGSFASVDNAEFLSFPKNKSNENTVLLISITSISWCCFFSDCFFSILYETLTDHVNFEI